jgi:hypothetical protein
VSSEKKSLYTVQLSNGEKVSAQFVVGCSDDLPGSLPFTTIGTKVPGAQPEAASRSVTIISSPMQHLFVTVAEGGVSPAGAVVVFPAGSLSSAAHPPVQIMVHSSDTGECPQGQCKFYSSPFTLSPGSTICMMNDFYEYLSTLSETIMSINTSLTT